MIVFEQIPTFKHILGL